MLAWVKRFDLVRGKIATRRFHDADFAQFSAVTCPRATDLDLICEWNGYIWLVVDEA